MKKFFEKWQWLIATISAAGLLVFAATKKDQIKQVVTETVSNMKNEGKILTLHPAIRSKARQFINAAEAAGISLLITSGFRSIEKQNELYNQGRTDEGKILTNAKGGQSYHNYGLAIDVVPIENGSVKYNTTQWAKIGAIGKANGFEWGGDFKSLVDKPHFQISFGKSTSQLLTMYNNGQRSGEFVNLA